MIHSIKIILATASILGSLLVSTVALAAPNPSGTGQPGRECSALDAQTTPTGFLTDGFAKAETRYAGSDGTASLAHSNSSKAVSQYDVACFQLFSR